LHVRKFLNINSELHHFISRTDDYADKFKFFISFSIASLLINGNALLTIRFIITRIKINNGKNITLSKLNKIMLINVIFIIIIIYVYGRFHGSNFS
jgi:hypothetical protein